MPGKSPEDGPDTLHHIYNRGFAKRTVFEGRDDIRYFQSRLQDEPRLEGRAPSRPLYGAVGAALTDTAERILRTPRRIRMSVAQSPRRYGWTGNC